ncbi:MAG TPA: ATP-binding protein, partial [Gammaproteobacteria bacterium]|nr:ATP-binding protein [Gammaproteobacteria bacterium]
MASSARMDGKAQSSCRFVSAVVLRAVLLGALAFAAMRLFSATHLYATAICLLLILAAVVADLASITASRDRLAERDLEQLLAEAGNAALPAMARADHGAAPSAQTANMLTAARAERQRRLEYLQSLLDTVAAALLVMGSDGKVTLANRAARSLAGEPVSTLREIAPLGAGAAERLQSLNPGAKAIVSLKDGRRLFASATAFAAPGSEPQRLVSLQHIAGELDAVELRAWQDMAAVLAHEMMNSLTPIASLSESLEALLRNGEEGGGTAPPEELAGALEVIKRRSLGLMDFVERYRAIAELPAARPLEIRMDQFLQSIERLLGPTFRDKGIAYRSSVAPAGLCIAADPELLEQAVINLLRNACDAVSQAARPQVQVECALRSGELAIEVTDNGCGIPPARRDEVFVPFFTTKAGGSGIGLNLARQIALAHGGRLELRSPECGGSVFALLLPGERAIV